MKRSMVGLAVAWSTFGLAGCVGDTSGPTHTIGEEGQSCYTNGTCDGTLTCISKVCVALDGSTPADSGASDASADAIQDCGSTFNPIPWTNGGCVAPNVWCDVDELCEPSSSCAIFPEQCSKRADCSQNGYCCVTGTIGTGCPPSATFASGSGSVCSPLCGVGSFALCTSQQDCSALGLSCTPAYVSLLNATIGLCR